MGYNNKNREGTYMSENEKPKHNNKNCAIKKGLRIYKNNNNNQKNDVKLSKRNERNHRQRAQHSK